MTSTASCSLLRASSLQSGSGLVRTNIAASLRQALYTTGQDCDIHRRELRKDALFPRGRPPFAPGVIVFRDLSGIQSGRPTHRQRTSAPLIAGLRLKKMNDLATSIFLPAPLKQDGHHTSKKVQEMRGRK